MSTLHVVVPTSRLLFAMSRSDVTPPVGHYHRVWGAARHERSTGVHWPLLADILAFAPIGQSDSPLLRIQLDLVGLNPPQHEPLRKAIAAATNLSLERVIITYSHTHASGRFEPDRFSLPGGELLPAYLEQLQAALIEASRRALTNLSEATITYGVGSCRMAGNRNYWDEAGQRYVCGFNPDSPADDTVTVARITNSAGQTMGTIVHYACHPTTLAWENTLTSPDFVGAARELVERQTGVPCIYLQGPSGDLGPKDGYTGDTQVADRNGRQLGYAALSVLESLGPPQTDFAYQGAVISGATLGIWGHVPFGPERRTQSAQFMGGEFRVDLPLKPRPSRAELEKQLEYWNALQREADMRGDTLAARDAGARAERARRWLGYMGDMPESDTYPLHFSVYRLGDAYWVTCGGEPFSLLQTELRRRFPNHIVLVSPMASDYTVAYLMPAGCYGIGLYQEEPSSLGKGCLEILIEAIAEQMKRLS